MKELTWLHLSDWHQRGPDFDRKVIRDALIRDIGDRQSIDPRLAQVDFVVFSGDLAFAGEADEYEAARKELLEPVQAAVGLRSDSIFLVPGNHDLNRETIHDMMPPELQKPLDSDALVHKWLENPAKRARAMEPLENYRAFVTRYNNQPSPDYASIKNLEVKGTRVSLLGINSAWMNGRNLDAKGEVNDRGYTLIGEPQIHEPLAQIEDAHLRIAVVHHPFDWLSEFDRNHAETRLCRSCHFILRGHVHFPQVQVINGTMGDCTVIPAGACYDRRLPQDPRYTSAYNWVHLDLETSKGTVYLRRWSDQRNEWIEDIESHPRGTYSLERLPKDLGGKKLATKAPLPTLLRASPPAGFEQNRTVLEGYLNALIRNNTDLEPGGIKQTKVQVVLPLDEIYVGLQADRDRPDVDRRVMQEELEEIKKSLEREEDPQRREEQYQIWASQARTLREALEISGPREELANIVQRHREVVILGDPGSGKTTLLRYLALRFARAILLELDKLFRPQELWDQRNIWRLPDLGPIRLPILLRISHYAEARQKDPDLALADYLPRYFAGLSVPYANELGPLLRRFLDEGRCMVLLDGLDEIIDPVDRRKIATAVGQFAGTYSETGLPDWLPRSLAIAPTPLEEDLRGDKKSKDEGVELTVAWDKTVPEDVRKKWEQQIKEWSGQKQRRSRVVGLAWKLLTEERYAHVGNRFVVTSRIAGYHFAGVPGEFEHYTIRRMSLDEIKVFLERWCPALERGIAAAPDTVQVESRARREINGILRAIETSPGVRRMAENPLLLRILAIIHRNEAHLPQRRVELYETATVTLLRDWNLERGAKGAVIDDVKATSLLGPVAFYIHENRPSGFLSKGETENKLAGIMAAERGEALDRPSTETREAVHHFLETVREHSGLFVERGEGLYGFMHLTFEEYFTARHLVSRSAHARDQILKYLHLPRWREPILLAVGSLSKQFYEDTRDLLRAILDARSDYEEILHRDLLFAAICVGDSVNVAPVLRQEIARRLLALYCDNGILGRYTLLRQQVKEALLTLCNDQGDAAVEAALAEKLMCCDNRVTLASALDVVEWLNARTPAVADALASCPDLALSSRAQGLLFEVQLRCSNGKTTVGGWNMVRSNPALARLFGVMLLSRYQGSLQAILEIPKEAILIAERELLPLSLSKALESAGLILEWFDNMTLEGRNLEFWNEIGRVLEGLRGFDDQNEVTEAVARVMQSLTRMLLRSDIAPEIAEHLFRRLARLSGSLPVNEARGVDELPLDQALSELKRVTREQEGRVANLDLDQIFQSAGAHLLGAASKGHTMASTFAAIAQRFGTIPLSQENLAIRVEALQSEIGTSLLALLKSSSNGQQYQDAALFLGAKAAEICRADLDGEHIQRRCWALQAHTSREIRTNIQFTEKQRNMLLELLDAPTEGILALDILFDLDLGPDLLWRCWEILRCASHSLAHAVLEKLHGAKEVPGDRVTLALLNEGLRDDKLRPIALELVQRLAWHGSDTFVQSLAWLSSQDVEVQHLSALLLGSQEDVLEEPRLAFARAAREIQSSDERSSWTAAAANTPMVRLLGELWLNGWDDALVTLWVGEMARPYVDTQFPTIYWYGSLSYPNSEDCIRLLLEKANSGQVLLPTFQSAAGLLEELEGASAQGQPKTEHINAIQEEIFLQLQGMINRETVTGETLAGLNLLLQIDRPPAWFYPLLWSLRVADNGHPLAVWLKRILAASNLTLDSTFESLSPLLGAKDVEVRAAASLGILVMDPLVTLVQKLLECAKSPNDRIRTRAMRLLLGFGDKVQTNGNTNVVETLLRLHKNACDANDALAMPLTFNALSRIRHTQPCWIIRWLEQISDQGPKQELAILGLEIIHRVSADVQDLICTTLNDWTRPIAVRQSLVLALGDILRIDSAQRNNISIHKVLIKALADPAVEIRCGAAHGLQWVKGEGAWPAAEALLKTAESDVEIGPRTLALRSLGSALQIVRGSCDVDVSSKELLRWLEDDAKTPIRSFEALKITEALKQFRDLPAVREMHDADALMAALSHPDRLGLPRSAELDGFAQAAKEEWEKRRYWLEKSPLLSFAISRIETFLGAPEPVIRRAAACALARLYQGDDHNPERLRDLLPDDASVLRALLDGASDAGTWTYEGGLSHVAVKQIVSWLETKPTEERGRLVDGMLGDLDKAMGESTEEERFFNGPFSNWPLRRVLSAVLAELSERGTYRTFTAARDLPTVMAILVRAAKDDVFYVRRFSNHALGNLQQLNEPVAEVFFDACKDLDDVYRETRTAVAKFKFFGPGSLEKLTAAIRDPSITVAYHAALLLGELGISRSEDLGPGGRKRVADELAKLLNDPISERIVYDFSEGKDKESGPLYDVIYNALVRVVAGPDSPETQTVQGRKQRVSD